MLYVSQSCMAVRKVIPDIIDTMCQGWGVVTLEPVPASELVPAHIYLSYDQVRASASSCTNYIVTPASILVFYTLSNDLNTDRILRHNAAFTCHKLFYLLVRTPSYIYSMSFGNTELIVKIKSLTIFIVSFYFA